MPRPTPFHGRTAILCESHEWRNWAGYLAASTYEPTHEREYYAIRNAAGLIDVSPLFKYDVVGPDALKLINKAITRDARRCAPGRILYTPWCDQHGHIVDDGTVWRLAENHFRVTAAEPNLRWLQDCGLGLEVSVSDISTALAGLALQGPNSRAILAGLVEDIDLAELKFYHLAQGHLADFPLTVTRTGYTGDLGYELWVEPQYAERLWDHLVEEGQRYGLLPAGMVALDIARIEAGLLLIDVDYISSHRALIESRKSTPYEAGLGWAVSLKKGPFIGWQALQREKERGSAWAFVGLEIDWVALEGHFAAHDLPPLVTGRASRLAVPVYEGDGQRNGRQIGQATSRTFSPILKKYIALATVESAYSEPGTTMQIEVTVDYQRERVPARVVKTPFFNPPRKRA